MNKFLTLTAFVSLLLLGVGCTQQPSAIPQPTPIPTVQEEQKQEAEEESFDTNDYLDEALKELDVVE